MGGGDEPVARTATRCARGRSRVGRRVSRGHERLHTNWLVCCKEARERGTNAAIDSELPEAVATPGGPERPVLAHATEAMRLSARGYTRMPCLERTIADLAGPTRSAGFISPNR
ncbi:hypothetical protein [Sphingopyxis sp. NFH-91]|uniref:magnesium chelatase subunit ChlI family protein n=1 Tax=Sphingopyxis sp. NFH-91 TaxID=2744457 RepID=UPI001F44179A|nr:hypothetical protein [Sphingopyxis sp. NFH-91]